MQSAVRSKQENIEVRGARVHNLKNVSLSVPINKLTVITGVSGSGKSSLAFDTIYAEGQRRYVESLSAYARQFLERMEKPDVDSIEGLSPAVAIEQKNPTKTSRSTVGTATEIYDYLRLLWARVGHTYCPKCGRELRPDTVQSVADAVLAVPAGTRFSVAFPLKPSKEVSHDAIADGRRHGGGEGHASELHRALRVPERRHARARADAAALLLQQPPRRLPDVQRLRGDPGVRRDARRPLPRAVAARRRDRPVDE